MDRFGLSAQFDFNSGDSANQISGVSKAITSLIDTIQDLEQAVGNSDNFGKKIAKQLDFAPKKGMMRGVSKDVTAIGKAATDAKKSLSPLKDEFRALRAESRNIDMGNAIDIKQYRQGRSELEKYTKSLKTLQSQVHGNSTAEREFNASLIAGQAAAKNKLSIMESQRKALRAAEKVGISQAAVGIGRATIDPVKQFATDSMKILSDFDDKMAAVAAVVGPTAEQLKGLRKQAAALGASTRYDAAQAAEAMGELGSAGFTAQQITIGLSDTLSLASAGALGLAQAAEISASSLNGFGLDVNQLGHVVDVFAIAAAKTNAGIQDIGETMKYAAPSAALFGATIEETTALIGTMANAGIKGSSSGTALRSMFTKLASPSKPALAALDGMGIKVKDATGQLRNVMEIMDDLQAKMGLNSADLLKQKNFFARVAATGENVDDAIAKLKASGDKQATNIETIKTIIGVEAMGGFSTALQQQAKTKQAVYAEMSASFDQDGFKTLLMETTRDNRNFDKLRELAADKSSVGQEKFKKLDINKYISESTASYTEATKLINKATSSLAMQGASSVKGDDLALVQKNLNSFKDTDEEFADKFKDIDFSQFAQGTDLLAALSTGTGSASKGLFQFQAAVKAAGLSIPAFVGAGKNMAGVMEDSLAGDTRNLQSALDSLRLNAIEPFEPMIRGIINTISAFANGLANLPTPIVAAIGGLQILALAVGAVLLAGGSIGVILFGFEQAAATAAIATTVLESSTIALTGFFGTSVAAAGALNPLNLELIALKGTAGQLFAPLGALKTLMFELGRAMLAQMMSPLGLTLLGLSALYLIFEALTPQFDVLGRLMGALSAPFGLIYGFAIGMGKALVSLVAPLVKISTTAAGFPFESVAKSLALAVDYFAKFATTGETAGRAFVDYFAGPIQMAASLIATAWDGAIGRIQGGMDGLVQYALNIAQSLISALNHNPTVVIPNSWDGATERITAALLGLIHVAQHVAGGMVAAFNWAVAGIANIPGIGEWLSNKLMATASELNDYLDNQLDFDVAGALIAKMEGGTAKLSEYFNYFGKTLLPGLLTTYLAGPLSQYFNKFTELAASLTGLKFGDIISVEEFDLGATLKIFDRIGERAQELGDTFRSAGDLITATFATFKDPNNTASFFSKIVDLITNGFSALGIAATAAVQGIGLLFGGALLSILPTIGVGISALTIAIQFVFKTLGGLIVGAISLTGMFVNTIAGATNSVAEFFDTFDLKTFFTDQVGAIDKTTTALGDNLNVLNLLALVGSTLPLGLIFSKGAITKELFKEIPDFYKAVALLLPAGMGTVIANGLTDEMIKGLGNALKALGAGLLNTLGISLDWYGLMKRDDFDAAVDGMGKKFTAAQKSATEFIMGIYNLPSIKPVIDAIGSSFGGLATDLGTNFGYINMAIRAIFDLLKTGFDIGDFHVSIVDLLGLDIAIKAAQGFVRALTLESFIDGLKAVGTSLRGVGGMLGSFTELFKAAGIIFEQFYIAAIPPITAFYEIVKSRSTEAYELIKTGVVALTRFVLASLRTINPEIYDVIAGNAKKAADEVVKVAAAGKVQAVALGNEAKSIAVALNEEINAVENLGKFAQFIKYLATTRFGFLVPPLEYAAKIISYIVKSLYAFPLINLQTAVGFLRNIPYTELVLFVKMFGKSLYDALAIVRLLVDGFGRLGKDVGKVGYLINNFFDIYKKTEGFAKFGANGKFGIKVLTPLDLILATSGKVDSQLSKIALMKFFKVSGSLGMITEESLKLGNILKNFGVLQKAALLPGVITYLATWVAAAPIILAILKSIAKVGLLSLGNLIGSIDYGGIATNIFQSFRDGLKKSVNDSSAQLKTFGSEISTTVGTSVHDAAASFFEGGSIAQKLGKTLGLAMVAVIMGALASGAVPIGAIISGTIAAATSFGARRAIFALAAAVTSLMIFNRDKVIASAGDFFKKIPDYFFAAIDAMKSAFTEIAANILAIIGTIGIMALFMGKQIRSIIATAFGSFTDAADKVRSKVSPATGAFEKIRQVRSDRQVDKDRTTIDKDALRLSASNNGLARTLLTVLNKTGRVKSTVVPEYERAGMTAGLIRRQELNLLDREVNRRAEQQLRSEKITGEGNGKSGMFAKFSTAQIEAEAAKIFNQAGSIRMAAFKVADSREARIQTDNNVNQAAIDRLNSDPTAARNKKGNFDKDQISQQEAQIRADASQMANLTVGGAFRKAAEDNSLAGSEALKGLGDAAERQKFINGEELIDKDLTIKANAVQLFVDKLDLPASESWLDDYVKSQAMKTAGLKVFDNEVQSGKPPTDVRLQPEAVQQMYQSFMKLPMRPDREDENGAYIRYGSGNNIKGNIGAGAFDVNDEQEEAVQQLKKYQASYLRGNQGSNTTFGQTVNQNIARSGDSSLSRDEVNRQEAILVLQLSELGTIVDRLGAKYMEIDPDAIQNLIAVKDLVVTANQTVSPNVAETYLKAGGAPRSNMIDGDFAAEVSSVIKEVYGESSSAAIQNRAFQTGTSTSAISPRSDRIAELELLKQAMVDLIGEIHTLGNPNTQGRQIQGKELAMMAQLLRGFKIGDGKDADGVKANQNKALFPPKAFQDYAMKSANVKPTDANHKFIQYEFDSQADKLSQTMGKDLQFFTTANERFGTALVQLGQAATEFSTQNKSTKVNPLEILDKLTSPDLISDANFEALIKDTPTTLDPETDKLLRAVLTKLANSADSMTPAMKKDLDKFDNPKARRAAAAARLVGIDVDTEVGRGALPDRLAVMANAAREELGFAMKSFMALAIPDAAQVKVAMKEFYQSMGVGNDINWSEVLPMPKNAPAPSNATKYQAIAGSFERNPQDLAADRTSSQFMEKLTTKLQTQSNEGNTSNAEMFMKYLASEALMDNKPYEEKSFKELSDKLGLTAKIDNSPLVKTAIAANASAQQIALAKQSAMGQLYLREQLSKANMPSVVVPDLGTAASEEGFKKMRNQLQGTDATSPNAAGDMRKYAAKVKNANGKNSIESILSNLIKPTNNPQADADKLRTAAQLIASGQLELLAPDLLLAVAAQTKRSVASLIRPNANPEKTDRVQVNILRRMEVQRRLKAKGDYNSSQFDLVGGGKDAERLYKGDFNALYADQNKPNSDGTAKARNFTDAATTLNLNGKSGDEAVVELMASLSTQTLMSRYEAKLALNQKNRSTNNQRSAQLANLAAEAESIAQKQAEDLAFKKLKGTRRYDNLMQLLIAQDPDRFNDMSAIGNPRTGLEPQLDSYAADPSLSKQIKDYNLIDILGAVGDNKSADKSKIEKFVTELVSRRDGGSDEGSMKQYSNQLFTIATKLGINTNQLAEAQDLDLSTHLGADKFKEVEKIFSKMQKNEDNNLGAAAMEEMSNSNKSKLTERKLGGLLSATYPTNSVQATAKDPKKLRANNLNQLFNDAQLTPAPERATQLPDDFYSRVLSGSQMPLQGTIENVKSATAEITKGLTHEDAIKPEVVKFMAELADVQQQLELAVTNNTSPVMAIAKLIRLQNRANAADTQNGLDEIGAIASKSSLSDKNLFSNQIDPQQISPEIFGDIRSNSGAADKLNTAKGGKDNTGFAFNKSADYQMAAIDASLSELTDGYEVHNKKLLDLRNQFAKGSEDFYSQLIDEANADLLQGADGGKLFTALQAMYTHAGANGIDLSVPGAVRGNLTKFASNSSGLGLTPAQMQLVSGFADTTKASDLTLDPMIRAVQQELQSGAIPDRQRLSDLKKNIDPSNENLAFLTKQTDGSQGQKPNDVQSAKINEMSENVGNILGSTNFGAKQDRELVEQLIANGKANATKLGSAVAAEYSILYAYVDPDTNQIDTSILTKSLQALKIEGLGQNEQKQILADIVEGRRKTIDRFNESERNFIDAFADALAISRDQLFSLDKMIPKTTLGKIIQAPSNILAFIMREYRQIQKQKDFSLNKFMSRAGIDYEELTDVLKQEGFDANQIMKLYQGSQQSRSHKAGTQKRSQSNLVDMLKRYGGMTKKQAKESIVSNLAQNANLSEAAAASQLQVFVEAKIKEQGYTDRALDKIYAQVKSITIGGIPTGGNRYANIASRGFKLSEQIGASAEQVKLLATLMGVNQQELEKFFTDKGGILGEFAYAGDYVKSIVKAFDPLNLNRQLAKILVGTKTGDKFAAKADQIAAKRDAKLEAAGINLRAMLVDPIVGSILRQFKTPAESLLDGVIKITADSSDWVNNYFGGRVFGAGFISNLLNGAEKGLRDAKYQAQKIADMPGVDLGSPDFLSRGIEAIGTSIGEVSDFMTAEVAPKIKNAFTKEGAKANIKALINLGNTNFLDKAIKLATPAVSKFKQAFTGAGAKTNIKGLINLGHTNRLNQGIKTIVTSIGEAMQLAATEAIDLAEGQQVVTDRDLNGVRTTVNEQRAPLQTLKKKVGGILIRFADPMRNLTDSIGNFAIGSGRIGLDAIEQMEAMFAEIQAVDLPGKAEGMAGELKDKLVKPFEGLVLPPALEGLKQKIHSNITSMFETIGNAFDMVSNTALGTLSSVLGSVLSGVKNAFRGLGNFGRGLVDKFRPKPPAQPPADPWENQTPAAGRSAQAAGTSYTSVDNSADSPWFDGSQNPMPPAASAGNSVPTSVQPFLVGSPAQLSNTAQIAADAAARNRANQDIQAAATALTNNPVVSDTQFSPDLSVPPINLGDAENLGNFGANFDASADSTALSGQVRYVSPNPEIISTTNPVASPSANYAANVSSQSIGINTPTGVGGGIVPTPTPISQLPPDDPNRPRGGAIVPYQLPMTRLPTPIPVAPVPQAEMIRQLPTSEDVAKQSAKPNYAALDAEINQKIEENWDGTSDSIIKNIKNIALVSKKIGYWIMRNLSEGSPGPTFYMRQHYAHTADFIEDELKRLVTVAQRSGRAIQSSLTGAGDTNPIDFSDLARGITAPSSPLPNPMAEATPDDAFTAALSQTSGRVTRSDVLGGSFPPKARAPEDQFTALGGSPDQSANQAAAQLAHNATVTHDQTTATAAAMVDVAKGENRVALVGKKIFKLFTLMGKVMKFVPKGFVRIGAVFKKIGKPVMMMGAGLGAAGYAVQNIASNLSTLGLVNEQQTQMISKGSAMMEILGGIGAIGGAAMQVLAGGFAFVMEAGVALIAAAFNPITYAVIAIGATAIASIFALNWLSETFLGFDFIAPIFGGIEGSMSSLSSFIGDKLSPIVANLRYQFAQTFGYDALAKFDGAFSWLGNAWNAVMVGIGIGLDWLQGVISEASKHIVGVIGILTISCAPLIAIGFLTFKLFEALFNAIGPRLATLMPMLDELAVKFQAAFGPTIDWIVAAWQGGLDKIGGMLVGLWKIAEDVGNWLIGSLNCNPTIAIPLAWQGAVDSITGMMNFLPDRAKDVADRMTGFFTNAFSFMGKKTPDIQAKLTTTEETIKAATDNTGTGAGTGTLPTNAASAKVEQPNLIESAMSFSRSQASPTITVPQSTIPTAPETIVPIAKPNAIKPTAIVPSVPALDAPVLEVPQLPEVPDWAKGIQSLATEKMAAFSKPEIPIPADPTGSLKGPSDVAQMLETQSAGIKTRAPMLLQGGAERKAERMDETARQIKDLVKQSEYLQSEYADLANPQGIKKYLAFIGRYTGSTEKRTKEIIAQRGEIEQTLAVITKVAKAEMQAPVGGNLLRMLGIDPDALSTAATELQAGVATLGAQLTDGIEKAVAPVATYWNDAMTSIAEVGVGGTAQAIFGGALHKISGGVGTVGQAFNELGSEVFESLKTMDFKRLQAAGTMFTSTLGEGLAQIARGFGDAAAGAAFFATFSVTSGLLPAIVFGGLILLLILLTLKFGNLREIAVGAFEVMVGAAKVFWVALSSIKPIVERLGDVFKGVFAAMKGDFDPLKEAIANLKLEFETMFERMAPGFAQISDGLKLIAKGFQPVIDEGIIPIVAAIKAYFGRVTDFILDPFRNAIAGVGQFGADLLAMAAKIVIDIQTEFSTLVGTIGASIEFAIGSVGGFFTDIGTGIRNIIGIAATTIDDIAQIFATGISKIAGAFTAAWDGINIGATGIEGIGKGIAGVANEITTLGGNILSSLGSATAGIRGEIAELGNSFIDTNQDLLGAFQTSFSRIGQLFPNLCGIFTDGVDDFTAYFTVKFQGIIEFVQTVFNGIGKIAGAAWDLAGSAFSKFDELLATGIEGISTLVFDSFGRIGAVLGSIGDKGINSFDSLLAAAKPMTDGLVAIFSGTVQDLDNLVQTGLDGFNGMVDLVVTGFTTAFADITTAGATLGTDLAAIPDRIGMAFGNLTGSIGQALVDEFTSIKASGSELLTALTDTFKGGTEQIGLMISGITSSFDGVSESITSTIENLKAMFTGLGDAIDGAMGTAFGGVKDKWQKTTGFMGKLMGKVAEDSEETGQLILHNMAENSPGPTQMIRERYAYTADSVNNSLATIVDAAALSGSSIASSLDPTGLGISDGVNTTGVVNPVATAAVSASKVGKTQGDAGKSLSGNIAKSGNLSADLLELAGQKDAAAGFKQVAAAIGTVGSALDGVQIAKQIGEDFQVLIGVMKGFSAVDAASKISDLATGLVESGKAAWDAIVGFGQWIVAKIFQTEVAVASEATTTAAVVAGSGTQSAAMLELAATTGLTGSSFGMMGAAAEFALGLMAAPLIPIIAGIAALIAIVCLVKAAFENNFLGFGDLIYGIGNAIGFVWNVITGFFGALLSGAAAIGGEVFASIGTAFTEIGRTIGMVFQLLAAPFVELFGAIMGVFAPIRSVLGGTNSELSATQAIVNTILFPLKIVGEILKFVIWCLGRTIQLFVAIAGVVLGVILAPFMAIAKILTFVFNIVATIVGAFIAVGTAIASCFLNPFQVIVGIVQWIVNAIGGLVGAIGGGLLAAIQAVMAPFSWLGSLFGGGTPDPGQEVQKFATGGYVSGAGGPTDDKIPAMLSNGEFVVGAEGTRKNLSFLQAINSGMPVEAALQMMDVPHPIGELPDRSAAGAAPSATATVAVNNTYAITVNFGDIVLDGATGTEAAEDFSRFLQSTEFQLAIQAALVQQVEATR